MGISTKVATRISTQLKRYQSILAHAKQRDVSESDTGVIVADMLADVLGYNKYQHVTTEYAIRGTYVDFAVVVDGERRFLIEVKAIGIDPKDTHVKQAIDYGANEGVEWVVLTNAAVWRVYKIHFTQPIEKTLVCEVSLLDAKPKSPEVIECFGNLSRECFSRDSMAEFLEEKQITSRFAVAAVLLGENLIDELRRELRRLSPGLKVDVDYLQQLLSNEIIKRDLVNSDDAKAACAMVKRLQRAQARERKRSSEAAIQDNGTPQLAVLKPSKVPAADETPTEPIGPV